MLATMQSTGAQYTAGGNVNWSATLENYLAISYKTKHAPYDPATAVLGIYSREIKTCVHTYALHTNVYSSSIHNIQKLETTQMSFNG